MSRPRGRAAKLRFLRLYLRSRLVLPVMAGILAVLGLATLWSWQLAPSLTSTVDREIVQRNVITGLAVIGAAALVLTVRSPWAEMDDAGGRTVRLVRLAVFLTTAVLVVLAMALLGELWESADAGWMLARAFGGWLGVTLISRQVLGESRGWLASFAWAGLSVVAGDNWRVHYPPWAWSMQDADNRLAAAVAAVMFLIGIGILVRTPIGIRSLRFAL